MFVRIRRGQALTEVLPRTPTNHRSGRPLLAVVPSRAVEHRWVDEPAACTETDLESVYRCYATRVSKWAQRLAGPDADVPDIVHDVFLIVERQLPGFRGQAKLSTWLYEITIRVVQTHRRRTRRLRLLWPFARGPAEGAAPRPFEIADERQSPLEAMAQRETTAVLYRLLDELDDKHRTAVVLFELEGLSCVEIAAMTGTTVRNVWARLSRGRHRLLLAYAKYGAKEST